MPTRPSSRRWSRGAFPGGNLAQVTLTLFVQLAARAVLEEALVLSSADASWIGAPIAAIPAVSQVQVE